VKTTVFFLLLGGIFRIFRDYKKEPIDGFYRAGNVILWARCSDMLV
jgi:hypothetical protein